MNKFALEKMLNAMRVVYVQDEDLVNPLIDALVLSIGDNIVSEVKAAIVGYVVGCETMAETLEALEDWLK